VEVFAKRHVDLQKNLTDWVNWLTLCNFKR